jgi:serine/threonine protein phosphatase PrpC
MQGWRSTMEDAHIANTELGEGNSLFAVFDGHAGQACSLFCKKYFCDELRKNANY